MSRRRNTWGTTDRAGWSDQRVGTGPHISVYCRGDDESPHEKWRIGSLVPSGAEWREANTGYAGYAEHGSDVYFTVLPRITKHLIRDMYFDELDAARLAEGGAPGGRYNWDFKCPRCRFALRISRVREAVGPLDELATLCESDGILEIGLRSFAAYIRPRL